MMSLTSQEEGRLVPLLEPFVTQHKRDLMQSVLDRRTRWLTVALEDIHQPHNASAILRSCECFGIQDVHIIENRRRFIPSPGVAMGAEKWLDLHRFHEDPSTNSASCLDALRRKGYRIVAATTTSDAVPLPHLSIEDPMALFFGTEETGLSKTIMEGADECVHIPMFGFTRSFNVSVSVALCLQSVCARLHTSDLPWRLNSAERRAIYFTWLRRTIPHADAHIRRLRAQREMPCRTERDQRKGQL